MKRAGIFSFILILVIACGQREEECKNLGQKLLSTAKKEGDLRCKLAEANQEAESQWDEFNQLLIKSFAPSTNQFIRSKMLEMRNAELLRMFQSFDSLDLKAKTALDVTEKIDSTISRKMLLIQKKLDDLEERKMSSLLKLENQCPEKLEMYRVQYQVIMKNNCDVL